MFSTQNKINTLEAHRSETIKSIESLSDAFNQKLQKAGFPNESSFLSSQISTAQKDDLMRQNDELLERYRVVNSQYEEKQQALNSLQEKNLTTRTREQLEEELLEKSDLFHTATAQLTGLREKMAKMRITKIAENGKKQNSKSCRPRLSDGNLSAPMLRNRGNCAFRFVACSRLRLFRH